MKAPIALGSALVLLFATLNAAAAARDEAASSTPIRVAVTVDDIPEHGDDIPGLSRATIARDVLRALKQNGLSQVYGFANGAFMADDPSELSIFKDWLAAGYPLGNHTYHHPHLDQTSAAAYVKDIAAEDRLLATLVDVSPLVKKRRVFRYPYLEEGNTQYKRDQVRTYLADNGYRIAEVTIDFDDWAWTDAYARCLSKHDESAIEWLKKHIVDSANRHLHAASELARRLFGHDIAQVLLVHVGAFDAIMLDMIFREWRQQGVQFVTLDEALADPAYSANPNLISEGGRTFLEQIAESRHADTNTLLDDTYSLQKINAVCKGGTKASMRD